MNKKLLAFGLVLTTLAPLSAFAAHQDNDDDTEEVSAGKRRSVGVGAILGDPTGFVFRTPLSLKHGIHSNAAYSIDDFFQINADFTWDVVHPAFLPPELRKVISLYVGVGPAVYYSLKPADAHARLRDKLQVGFRIPLGFEWQPESVPLGIFLEAAPGMNMLTNTDGFLQGGIGIIFYFI